MQFLRSFALISILLVQIACAKPAQQATTYKKIEYHIPMRDGVKLYTAVYVPTNVSGEHPIMLERTPYSSGPYGPEASPRVREGKFSRAGYIFAYQDVRGRFMSEGKFEEIRPLRSVQGQKTTDESTDAYDTADFLVKNVPDNNGRIGVRGVSYPGFYAACAGVNTHPAIKAIEPGAPVSEWFFGDDVHHNGAFFLQDNFDFYFGFGYDMPSPAPQHPNIAPMGPRPDSYKWFLEQGSPQMLEKKFYQGHYPFWNDIIEHPSYDKFWQERSTPKFLKNVKCAVLTVGGLYDAEDLYGAFDTYAHIEKNNPGIVNIFVEGPWSHGGWGGSGSRLGQVDFGSATGTYFRDEIEFPFFESFLNGKGDIKMPDVRIFDSGKMEWKEFDQWPPKGLKPFSQYLRSMKGLADQPGPIDGPGYDQYVSDPLKPVPYLDGTLKGRNSAYMIADQSFACGRDDVLTYTGSPFKEEVTVAGAIYPELYVSSTSTDLDLVCKVIDVYSGPSAHGVITRTLVRADPMPVRFRDSFEKPKPLTPGEVVKVRWRLPDVMYTFKKGHQIMIQIQSSWFPLVAMNPQTFGNPYTIPPSEWKKATVSVHYDKPSLIEFTRL